MDYVSYIRVHNSSNLLEMLPLALLHYKNTAVAKMVKFTENRFAAILICYSVSLLSSNLYKITKHVGHGNGSL